MRAFYDLHPYPPPVDDLDGYRQRWQDEDRRRADFHLHWPDKAYRADLQVLVAGCGTAQAAKHALREPGSHVVGIDFSAESVQRTEALKSKYNLTNLEVHQLPVERVGELGRRFDKIVCTGVLHHLPEPEAGLRALREVLTPDGAMHLMVYAPYGRAGVYMLQEYCRRLGIGHTEQEIQDLAVTLTALPRTHPLARLLGESPDFQRKDALADALLNPQDRAYTVPQIFELIAGCGLTFGRWVRQAPYLAQCGGFASTPHAARLARLPPSEQYAAVELLRGNMLRHNLIVYRDDVAPGSCPVSTATSGWTTCRCACRRLSACRIDCRLARPRCSSIRGIPTLICFCPSMPRRCGWSKRSMAGAPSPRSSGGLRRLHASSNRLRKQAHELFERLWWYDQIVFETSRKDEREGNMKDHLPGWNDTPAKQAILDFVAAVTDEAGPTYVPPAERIAVFDNDGTLWCEKPMYIQMDFILRQLAARAESDPALRTRQPWQAAWEQDFAWFGNAMTQHYLGDDSTLHELLGGVLALSDGRNVEEVEAAARLFVGSERHPTLGLTYRDCIYQPMVELLRFLEANGFLNYIVSGGGRDFMRGFAQDLYGIPRERVIGSTVAYRFVEDEDGGAIVQRADLDVINDGPDKAVQVWNVIGRRPIVAAGNSNGDLAMLTFAGGSSLPALRLLVVHDDAAREFEYIAGAERSLDAAQAHGWTAVSMKDTWRTVFPEASNP